MRTSGSSRFVRLASSAAALVLLCGTLPSAQTPTPAPTQTSTATLPSARAVIDRSVEATGGAAALKSVRSIRAKGTLAIPTQDLSGDFEMLAARPSKTLTKATLAGVGNLEEGYDGKVGWSIDPVSGPVLVVGRALMERADESWFDAPLHADNFVRQITMVGREDFDRRAAYRLKVTLASGLEQEELFDVDSGLQIGLEARRETPFGSAPTTTIYRDFKKFGALMLPTTQVQRILGIEQVVTVASYEFNVVPAGAFDLPPAVKALIK